ncbi:MAG: DUF2073 domain-containing protein [Candidatus Nanohaloarchaea archaeon]|nr:DUF2073 domain-containing protein [Candidatus Nanohaloarchaea archaeon]
MDGTPIEFIGKERLEKQPFKDKLEMVLEEVRDGKILILENPLTPDEKKQLIKSAMENIDDDFPGIEFSSMETEDIIDQVINNVYQFLGRDRRRGLTIVGNSEVMEKVKEDKGSVSLVAKAEKEAE